MTLDERSTALRSALEADLGSRLGPGAPTVWYAWVRSTPGEDAPQIVMFAKLHADHRSAVIEGSGPDSDSAYRRLLERCAEWAGETRARA